MDKGIGWSVRQLATGNFRAISGSDLRTDLLALINVLVSYGEFCQKNPQEVKASDIKFAGILLRATRQFTNTLKNTDKNIKAPLLKKPLGPSELGKGFGTYWNNQGVGTTRAVVCEICGTEYPELDENETGYTISRFMDYQVVEECCGAVIDHVYGELGEEFAIAFVEEFADNPADFKYHILLVTIKKAMEKAKKKLAETSQAVAEISEAAKSLGK